MQCHCPEIIQQPVEVSVSILSLYIFSASGGQEKQTFPADGKCYFVTEIYCKCFIMPLLHVEGVQKLGSVNYLASMYY